MVTVLGVQKILNTFEEIRDDPPSPETVLVPLSSDSIPGIPSLQQARDPIGNAIDIATRAVQASRTPLLLAPRTPPQDALAGTGTTVREKRAEPTIHEGTRHMAIVIGTLANGMLAANELIVPDATSYEEVSDEELALFDEGPFAGPIALEDEIAADKPYVPEWRTYTVESGDTFALLAQEQFNMGYREVMNLLEKLPEPRLLTHWRAGNRFDYQLDANGQLIALRIMKDARAGYQIERDADTINVATIERAGEATQRLYAGTVIGSFARSAQATGLTSKEIAELTHVLEKRLDFRRDSRRGDRFQVLVESDLIDGENLDPRVLAASYAGERMNLTLVRNPADNRFYTPDGESLDPAFNRHPFKGSYRLSSHFNPKRRHPISKRVRPHKGTDFAMPIGTSVLAPSAGRVVKVGNHPGAGRYVEILHDNGYKTRYLHLSRPLVKNNQRVEMGERIALSGNTGASTGPHLHYEVLVNNRQVDAMKVPLPENRSLSGQTLAAFKTQVEPLMAALESGATGTVVASTAGKDPDES
ncbi:MAG TPA: peptidoglycan DD-metalloendopeptidase family protein [Halomonas sp.]|nr:peptidoglycan DD-metalloendopeptidase family protein [Halomonas sp.]